MPPCHGGDAGSKSLSRRISRPGRLPFNHGSLPLKGEGGHALVYSENDRSDIHGYAEAGEAVPRADSRVEPPRRGQEGPGGVQRGPEGAGPPHREGDEVPLPPPGLRGEHHQALRLPEPQGRRLEGDNKARRVAERLSEVQARDPQGLQRGPQEVLPVADELRQRSTRGGGGSTSTPSRWKT